MSHAGDGYLHPMPTRGVHVPLRAHGPQGAALHLAAGPCRVLDPRDAPPLGFRHESLAAAQAAVWYAAALTARYG